MAVLIGRKIDQDQAYNQTGQRLAVTRIKLGPCVVVSVTPDPDNQRQLVTLGLLSSSTKKHPKPVLGTLKKAKVANPKHIVCLRQFVVNDETAKYEPGQTITLDQQFKPGDLVNISGVIKGRGFAGVMKRWGFHGGPKTHGQSDRPRSPGSIGAGSTPGRVYKGKKMAGHYGHSRLTLNRVLVLALDKEQDIMTVKGLIPGSKSSLVTITSTGQAKTAFTPLATVTTVPENQPTKIVTTNTLNGQGKLGDSSPQKPAPAPTQPPATHLTSKPAESTGKTETPQT